MIAVQDDTILAHLRARVRLIPPSIHRILLLSLIVKLMLSALLPLTSDEAYYWVWSQKLQLSYYDHPAAVAWLFWISQGLENFGSAVRWGGVLMSQGTLLIWLLILRPYFSDEQLKDWLWLGLLSPLFGAGGILITPDIPLLFFWALTLYFFVDWVERPTVIRSSLLGLCCGLGFVSKYMMVLEPMFLFAGCLYFPKWRKAMKESWHWIFFGLLAGSSPLWAWNYLNDFVSFRFQASHGLGRPWKPSWTSTYILSQIALIFPTILFFAIRGTKRAPAWLWMLAWGPLLFFVFTSFRGFVEANWPIAAYPAILALAIFGLGHWRKLYQATIGIWAFAIVLMFLLIVTRWSPTGEPIKSKEFFEFEVLTPEVEKRQHVFARSYQMAAKLSFELKRPVPKLKGMNRRDYYDFIEESEPRENSFFLAAEKTDVLPKVYTDRGFKIVTKAPVDGSSVFEIWEVSR